MDAKVFIFKNPKILILCSFIVLLAMGFVNVYSASFVYAATEMNNIYHFAGRYLFFTLLGIISMIAVRKIGYQKLLSQEVLLGLGGATLILLICVLAFGPEINAAHRWIDLKFFNFQPSELAKLFVIMLFSKYLGEHIQKGRAANIFHAPASLCIVVTLVFVFLVYVQPDLGTASIIGGLAFFMCLIGGIRWIQVGLIVVPFLAVAVFATLYAPYRLARIFMWLDPWQDPTGSGYQMVQSQIAIGSGGFTGMDWGAGTAKFFFLPELHTDFAFAIYCQENGFAGAAGMIAIFLLLGYGLWTVSRRAGDPTGSLLVGGVSILVVGQAVANMAMVCGLLPIIGVPLSFISYGGSSMVVSCIALGLALAVYDYECEKLQAMQIIDRLEEDNSEYPHGLRIIRGGKK